VAFNAMWKPGRQAVAGMQGNGSANPALVIYLDPDSLAILPPSDPAVFLDKHKAVRDDDTGPE